ncbi:DnaB-like helicase C-terminal domain-containing protein [Novosphingobium sp. HII-3]|uniref:replicative DNA helicase n=1 Tax=Novosphingobium sp. HII-3 TaxID=2075565 RepID=UPI000CDA255C|nr:DnaB-like helicase C-terminal domain-containing protein [Novosphingobium sp. HII-3]
MLGNVEAEAALLGALMQGDPGIIDLVVERLQAADFYEPVHERLYAAIVECHGAGKPVTPVLLKPRFDDDEGMKRLGGVRYLARLTADGQGLIAPRELAEQIADLAVRRRMQARFTSAAGACGDLSMPIDAVAAQGEVPLEATPGMNSRTYTLGEAFRAANDRIDDIQNGTIAAGVRLNGLQDWDDVTRGMRPGTYILVGGRPSMGKTAMTLSVARRAAQAGHGVLYVSREMDIVELMPRIQADLLAEAGGEGGMQEIREGTLNARDKALLRGIENEVADWPLVIIDPEKFGADQINLVIRQQARQFERRGHKLELVIIDYLGLIDPPPGRVNREQEVSLISQSIKQAARSNRIPIIVLSQLSRGVEQREDKHPQLSDLRDSGTLEQDADIVIFVYRDQYYLERSEPDPTDAKRRPKWEEDMRAAKDKMEIYSAKNRQGALCKRKPWFFGRNQAVRNSDFYRQEGF